MFLLIIFLRIKVNQLIMDNAPIFYLYYKDIKTSTIIIFMYKEIIKPIKSPNDSRQYQILRLPNQLEIALVHDPTLQKSACSICVGAGSLSDGQLSFGLAHFLEHMLFMGSRKFPRSNEFQEFISINDGYSNGDTTEEETNFYFDIANSKFKQGVQRLTDFFVEALLNEDCIQKQRNALHEEYKMACTDDGTRKYEIFKTFASGPYRHHSYGNNDTLSHPDIAKHLRQLYERQYSANRIKAAIVSSIPIPQLKSQYLPFFQQIKNRNTPAPQFELHYQQKNLGNLIKMQSIKGQNVAEFCWVVDSDRPIYKHRVTAYLAHVIGHQSQKSLLSILKQNQYSSQIYSYARELPKQKFIGLQVHLTENGQQNFEDVYNLIMDYVSWLKPEQFIHQQLKQSHLLGFQFLEKSVSSDYAAQLTSSMCKAPLAQIMSYPYFYEPFNPQIIDNYLRQLSPANLLLILSGQQQLQNPLTEPNSGAKYTVQNLPERTPGQTQFQSIAPNPFLPVNTTVLQKGQKIPTFMGNMLFVRGDFGVCKGGIKLRVHSDQSDSFLSFYCKYLQLLLKDTTYYSQCLNLQLEFSSQQQLVIGAFGFNSTVQQLFTKIGEQIKKAHQQPRAQEIFQLCIEDLMQKYDNYYENEVDGIMISMISAILTSNSATVEEAIEETQEYKFKAICKRIDKFWKKVCVDWVVVGNFDPVTVKKMTETFEAKVGIGKKNTPPAIKCLQIQSQKAVHVSYLQSEDIDTSGCVVYQQIGPFDELLYYKLRLLELYIKQPFFNRLRTQKQLAYFVAAHRQINRSVLSLNFTLVSSNADPRSISQHIHQFISDFLKNMETDLTKQKFQNLKDSIRTQISQPHNNLKAFYEFINSEVQNKTMNFRRKDKEQLQKYLQVITAQDLINILTGCQEKTFELWVVCQEHAEEFKKQPVKDISIQDIRSNFKYHADPQYKFQAL